MSSKKIKDFKNIDFNAKFEEAFNEMEGTNNNLFITGKAGTGKSTLLQYFRQNTKKKIVILAPTGVAALNVKGQTIHSFFKFGIGVKPESINPKYYKNKAYESIDAIVIDEVSMVRADLMDCIDRVLRLNSDEPTRAFGAKQVIFIGDLYQLPPILMNDEKEEFFSYYPSPYFFDSNVFRGFDFKFFELDKIYRQSDRKFIDILNLVRESKVEEKLISEINKRVDKFFTPAKKDNYIYLTNTNKKADEINDISLREIKDSSFYFNGEIMGKFENNELPTATDLVLKNGSQVMMLVNDKNGRWVNGTVAKITKINKEKIYITIEDKGTYEVQPYTWEKYKYVFDEDMGQMVEELVGSFKQYPLKLAWAITIHKSQGKTFENVILDIEGGFFAYGQAYVALSRCTTLNGLVLKKPINKRDIFIENRIVEFMDSIRNY